MWFLLACRHVAVVAPEAVAPADPALSGEARAFYVRAQVAESRGDAAEVVRAAEWVVRLDRANPWAWIHASELFLGADRADLATNAALEAVARAPGMIEAHRMLGFARLAGGEPAAALQSLERAPGGEGVAAATIRAHIAQGDVASAVAALVSWEPKSGSERLERAALTLALDRPDVARDEALALVDDPAVGPDALSLAVEAGRAACDLLEVHAVAVERVARASDPRWRPALAAAADATGDAALGEHVVRVGGDPVATAAWLLSAGRAEEALALLADDTAPAVRGRALSALGRTDEAAAAFAQVPDPEGLALRADLRLSEGATDEVLDLTSPWTRDPSVAWVRAGALVAAGRLDEAVDLVVSTASGPADAAVRSARVYALAGEPARERAALEEGLGAGTCPVEVWLALAPRRPRCEGWALRSQAAAVRVGDPALAAAIEHDRAGCAEIQGPR